MARTDNEYLQGPYYEPDDEVSNVAYRLVTTRKKHECVSTAYGQSHEIDAGTRAIYQTGIHVDDGRVSCYLCLACAGRCLNEMEAL